MLRKGYSSIGAKVLKGISKRVEEWEHEHSGIVVGMGALSRLHSVKGNWSAKIVYGQNEVRENISELLKICVGKA